MPYGKRNYRKKRFRPRRNYGKSLAAKVNRLSKMVKPEYKMTEQLAWDGQVIDNTGGTIHLNPVAQGDTQSTRDGNQIQAKSLLLRGRFLINASAVAGSTLRVMLVRDKQQVGDTSPSIANVLDSTGGLMYAPLNSETVGRFQVYMDRYIHLDANSYSEKFFKKYLKLNLPIRFNGSASSDIQKNGLYLMVISSESTNTPTVDMLVRFRYTDM